MEPGGDLTDSGPLLLPVAVRQELLELAAAVLGDLSDPEAPAALRKVRAFAPARRARAGAGPLAAALERDPAFRQRVASRWRVVQADLAQALDDGTVPAAADPQQFAVGVYLVRPTGWATLLPSLLAAAAERGTDPAADRDQNADGGPAQILRSELVRLTDELAEERALSAALRDEAASTQRELRRLRADADRARAAARAAEQELAAERSRADATVSAAEAAVAAAARQAQEALDQAAQARRTAREGRSLADSRVRLLLDTVVDAASGLRRELALPPLTVRPAEVVAAQAVSAEVRAAQVSSRGLAGDDPGLLAELLALPQSHLVVDGYNVTKSGYGTLPQVEQRRRLVDALAALAVRTSSEVTCCFDGTEVEASAGSLVRGVRVLFSAQGMTADELIRRLVRAEPAGRPVTVVSSDAEVVSGVIAAGARAVPAEALLRLLARGGVVGGGA